jgi:ABC-type multidrug transport system ATPase subunit
LAETTDIAIAVRDLAKTYRTPFRRRKVEALRGVTFSVKRGHIFGFVGPNGAGKTTTIRTLMGLIKPSTTTSPSASCAISQGGCSASPRMSARSARMR